MLAFSVFWGQKSCLKTYQNCKYAMKVHEDTVFDGRSQEHIEKIKHMAENYILGKRPSEQPHGEGG